VGRSAIVLAAGLGTRMKSKKHKVLHQVCEKPMIVHILDELEKLHLDQLIVVVGQQRDAVEIVLQGRAEIAYQAEQLGTGHAVQAAASLLRSDVETTVVLYGDAPLIQAETIERLLTEREKRRASAVVLTATVADPYGLGRVTLDADGAVVRIVEEKDATPAERKIRFINTGIYAYQTTDLVRSLAQLSPDNAQGEYYLTDTLAILRQENRLVSSLEVEDAAEIASVNDRAQLAQVEHLMRQRVNHGWMKEGVTLIDPSTTYIGLDVVIGQDTLVLPGTILGGKTQIGAGCVIGPNTRLTDVIVGDEAKVEYSVAVQSDIGRQASVGPFAYLRPGSVIGERVKIGDFVEIKNSTIGADSKVSHLSYVGDASVGKRVNVGCGVVTVNYDGRGKYRTVVGDDAFVGSNVNLIAPVQVGDGAYVVAGSTITDAIPSDGFAIARSRQVTKPNYVKSWKSHRFEKENFRGKTDECPETET